MSMLLRKRALIKDSERIEAARLAAERVRAHMPIHSHHGRVWYHFTDSVGGIHSESRRAGK